MKSHLVAVLCLAFLAYSEAAKAQYSDDFARNTLCGLAAAAYLKDPTTCITASMDGKLSRRIEVQCDPSKEDTCSGYVAYSDSRKAIALVFRGTTTDLQTLVEADESVLHAKVPLGSGHVSEYFFNAFLALWVGGMKNEYLSLAQAHPDYEIWITGHSLGGAMSACAANFLVSVMKVDQSKIKLLTIGEPRVGDKEFAQGHDNTFDYSFRVTHHHDIAPHIPFEDMGYYHHKYEVWYNNDMSTADYKVCSEDEDKSCSDGQLDLSIEEHHFYFNNDLGKWAESGCPRK